MKTRFRLIALIVAATFVLPTAQVDPAHAKGKRLRNEPEIARCIKLAAGGRPWLERTLWGLRDQEGGWIGAEVVNTNGSHDLGPLQINTWWVPKLARLLGRDTVQVRQWLRDDACFNAQAARWIFLSGLRASGDYWKAVGTYHSPTAWRQNRYALAVADRLELRFESTTDRSNQRR